MAEREFGKWPDTDFSGGLSNPVVGGQNLAFGNGFETGPNDKTPPTIVNLTPPDMSTLSRYDSITFDAVDVDSAVHRVLIWVKYAEVPHTRLIFDGSSFIYPFADQSTAVVVNEKTHRFVLKPTGGWVYNVTTLTIRVVDAQGNFDGEFVS